jgi:hypothetical protein
MNGDLLLTLVAGIGVVLVAFELTVALATLVASSGGLARATRFGRIPVRASEAVWLARPRLIRDHFADHRAYLAGIRARCRPLRSPGYGRQLRSAIRHRPATPIRFEKIHGRV